MKKYRVRLYFRAWADVEVQADEDYTAYDKAVKEWNGVFDDHENTGETHITEITEEIK
jgi:hypothetical protein